MIILKKLLSGELIGDIVRTYYAEDLVIERSNDFWNQVDSNGFSYLHSTKAHLNDILVGEAKTYLKSENEKWSEFKNIRMNVVLNKFGYKVKIKYHNRTTNTLYRQIISNTEFGKIRIEEKIYCRNINLKIK